jgi:CRP-like cAMP-binding protein
MKTTAQVATLELKPRLRKPRDEGLDCVRRQLENAAGPLSLGDSAALQALAGAVAVQRGAVLAPQTGFEFLLSGWACRQRVLEDGRTQGFALLLPGDVLTHGQSDASYFRTVALTDLILQDASTLLEPARRADPTFRLSVGLSLHLAEARLFDHVVRLGRRDAYAGIMDLFVELHARLRAVGLTEGHRFPFPIGQEKLGDMMGLSGVHVNRTLRQMKLAGELLAGPGWYALPGLNLGN